MKNKIVCMGDSLTEGYGIDTSCRWSDLLSNDMNIEIINSGISGDTTAGMLARFKSMVIDYSPSHVIIMGGTNDLSLNISDEQVIGNILAMTRYARYYDIKSVIGIPAKVYHNKNILWDSIFLDQDILKKRMEVYRNKLKRFAIEDECSYIDFSAGMTSDLYLEDGLHPNEAGHKIMMENAKAVLENIINIVI